MAKRGQRLEGENKPQGNKFLQTLKNLTPKTKMFISLGACVIALAAVALALVFTLGGEEETAEVPPETELTESSPAPDVSEEPLPEDLFEGPFNPLTGLPFLGDEEILSRRPIAVLLNNSHSPGGRHHALPMHGISRADIIFEAMAEGATTRMLAIFQDIAETEKIGSIRSLRRYYLELALAFDAVAVHDGGSPEVLSDIRAWGSDTLNRARLPADTFWQDRSDRPNVSREHTYFTSGEVLLERFRDRASRTEHLEDFDNGLRFNPDLTLEGADNADSIIVPFARTGGKRTTFQRNAESGLYYVYQYGGPFIDGSTGEQIAVANILIFETAISQIPGDYAGRLRVNLQNESGTGFYATGGRIIPILWTRRNHDQPFLLYTADGHELELAPGKIFACVIPTGAPLEVE